MNICEFPLEVIEQVFACRSLDIQDLRRASSSCWMLNRVCQSNQLWHSKFEQKYERLCRQKESECVRKGSELRWYSVYKKRKTLAHDVMMLLDEITYRFFSTDDISYSEFQPFVAMDASDSDAGLGEGGYVLDILQEIIQDLPRTKVMCARYCARKVAKYLTHQRLIPAWLDFKHMSSQDTLNAIETGAIMLSVWCQADRFPVPASVSHQLDALAGLVRATLRMREPNLDVCKAEATVVPATLCVSMWEASCCRKILSVISEVLFHGPHPILTPASSYDFSSVYNSYIDQVLSRRRGIPMTMCVIYQAVARRLGVVCDLLNFPYHVLLRFLDLPNEPGLKEEDRYVYIDAYNRGRLLRTRGDCLNLLTSQQRLSVADIDFTPSSPVQVVMRMLRNIMVASRNLHWAMEHTGVSDELDAAITMQNALELVVTLNDQDMESRAALCKVYVLQRFNLDLVHHHISDVTANIPQHQSWDFPTLARMADEAAEELEEILNTPTEAKRRDPHEENKEKQVLFGIGMVMQHRRYHYKCVIYGWDRVCAASQAWITQMGVPNLPLGKHQPFYNVLVDDNSMRYAAQENLCYVEPCSEIDNRLVCKYFTEYTGELYVPHPRLQETYPDDASVVHHYMVRYREQEREERN